MTTLFHLTSLADSAGNVVYYSYGMMNREDGELSGLVTLTEQP